MPSIKAVSPEQAARRWIADNKPPKTGSGQKLVWKWTCRLATFCAKNGIPEELAAALLVEFVTPENCGRGLEGNDLENALSLGYGRKVNSEAAKLGADQRLFLPEQWSRFPNGTRSNGKRQPVLYFNRTLVRTKKKGRE